MGNENIVALESFVSEQVEVAILDTQGGDQALFVKKKLIKIEQCPDKTHLRIYFDHFYYFAIPIQSNVIHTKNEWSALDPISDLRYTIRRVRK